jgi:PQQ-dependent dehydrogenase (methanol/ethanol family)
MIITRLLCALVLVVLASCSQPSWTSRPVENTPSDGTSSAASHPTSSTRAPASTQSGDTDWELLGNSTEMQHHSDLDQINTDTIATLGLAWSAEIPTVDGLVGNPLIKDGLVFQSGSLGRVFAHDVRTGELAWAFAPEFNFESMSLISLWASRFNRGVALSGTNVIVATGDCRLLAIDQASGAQVWEAQTCNPQEYYGITAAPRVGGGLVFTGNACADSGATRGYVDAFKSDTGEFVWRFHTVPGAISEEPKNAFERMVAATWGFDGVPEMRGCGSVWDAMTYDSELGLLYIGVAGPAPADPTQRASDAGDELFTNSIVALDAQTGEYVWHFKQVPHDAWNYDASMGIMIANLPIDGDDRRVVISVPKNGFVYVLDAKTGQFLSGEHYVPINWASGLNEQGRPISLPDARYWEQPDGSAASLPGGLGSHSWEALAFDPTSNLVYIPVASIPTMIASNPEAVVGGLTIDYFYGSKGVPGFKALGETVAWDPVAQKQVWRRAHALPINGGLLHTAGRLVFQGTADGFFRAYDSQTGKEVWSQGVGGAIRGAPSTVLVDGEQYVIVPSGNSNASSTGPMVPEYHSVPEMRTPPRLLAFKLGGDAPTPSATTLVPMPQPAAARGSHDRVLKGEKLFESYLCTECHGGLAASAGGSVPDLRYSASYLKIEDYREVILGGSRLKRGMPRFNELLTEDDVESLFTFVLNQAWDEFERQTSQQANQGVD